MEKCIIPCFFLSGRIMMGMVHNPLPINATVQTGYTEIYCLIQNPYLSSGK
ncbi:hypothetical protein MKX01_008521, partial [Papaver californicum]